MTQHRAATKGFTIVEVMIATGLFTVAIILGVGALLSANDVNDRTSGSRAVVDSLSFAMEDMTRNLRLGSAYECFTSLSQPVTGSPRDCANSGKIAFEAVEGDSGTVGDQVVYMIDTSAGTDRAVLKKSTTGGSSPGSFFSLTPSSVEIDAVRSGFMVTGSLPGDGYQPRVIIRLAGTVRTGRSSAPFEIQTTVSQRQIDL